MWYILVLPWNLFTLVQLKENMFKSSDFAWSLFV